MIGRCSAGVCEGVARLLNVARGPTDFRLGICRGLAGYRTNDARKTVLMSIFCLLHHFHITLQDQESQCTERSNGRDVPDTATAFKNSEVETQAGECILPLHHFTGQFELRAGKANRYTASAKKKMASPSLAHSLWPVGYETLMTELRRDRV